jgi:predicted aspartyl protease
MAEVSGLRSVFAFLGLCLFLQPPFAQAQLLDGTGTTARGGEIPFRLSGGFLIVVEGRIGALEGLKFILDTGVTRSVVDRKIADKLRLVRHPRQIYDFDKFIGIEWAVFPDVQLGPVRVANVSMSIADLTHFSRLASHVDALIGSDFLSLNPFTIDYNEKKVLFSFLDRAASESPVNADPVLLTVELNVQGQPVRLLVDTGFPDILLFEDRLLKRLPQLRIGRVIGGFRIGGRLHAKKVILPGIHLGAKDTDVSVLLAEAPPDNVLPAIDGLLGIASLKARRIDFNYASNSLRWE